MKTAVRAVSLIALAVIITVAMPIKALANYQGGSGHISGYSYFRNWYVGETNENFIDPGAYNSADVDGVSGYVLPNWWLLTTSNGGGAVGTKALGVDKVESDSNTLKRALFNYLQESNDTRTISGKSQFDSVYFKNKALEWEQMGSAFVVHTMLGQKTTDKNRKTNLDITNSEWDELENRLVNNPNITMSRKQYNSSNNSAGIMNSGNTVFDAARYEYYKDKMADSWVFTDEVSKKVVYALEIICSNPLGALEGLPINNPFELTPVASVNKTAVAPSESISVKNTVQNTTTTASNDTEWTLTRITYSPGAALTDMQQKGRDSSEDACQSFKIGTSNCSVVQQAANSRFASKSTKVFDPVFIYEIPSSALSGERICFSASVKPFSSISGSQWRHSSLSCVMVAKKPKVQIWGGDVRARDQINTSTSTYNNPQRTFGSWVEYGALSLNKNVGFASGAGLNSSSSRSDQADWSKLTFANLGGNSCAYGCYKFTFNSVLEDQFTLPSSPTVLTGNNIDLSTRSSGTYSAANLGIRSSTIPRGHSIVIIATGTVTIKGNINYDGGPYSSIGSIPQLVIKANTINISKDVTNIDAWLIADSKIDTCSDQATDGQLTSLLCSNPLRTNGPVITNKLFLKRTAGSEGSNGSRDDSAETFNLRADAFLWGSGYSASQNKIQTVYTRELPPRF